jgi:uncharacterized protein DUF4159
MKKSIVTIVILLAVFVGAYAQTANSSLIIARVKYSGGGDWYNDPSSEVNLLKYIANATNIKVNPKYEYVNLASDNLFIYPVIYLTGHGNVNFSTTEARKLRAYLEGGGFLYIDDDYGLDEYIRPQMKKVFPQQQFAELPFSHGIYSSHFKFDSGLPKVHEHDDKAPQGYGLFHNGRLCVFFAVESNLADGWADPNVHKDSREVRDLAFKMGTNIIVWALTN